MQQKNAGKVLKIRENIRSVFSASGFSCSDILVPPDVGAQLSMTGEIRATGNRFDPDISQISRSVELISPVKCSRAAIRKSVAERRFHVMCGELDRFVAIVGSVLELIDSGASKFVIASDSAEDRDEIAKSFEVMKGTSGPGISVYESDISETGNSYAAYAMAYSFLSSQLPQAVVISRDSFCRSNNIINRREGDRSPSALIACSAPVVIISASTIKSAKRIAAKSSVFSPCLTLVFTREVANVKSAVLYSSSPEHSSKARDDDMEQLGF
ncbi:MAG: hypothetical protein IJU57_06070 [Clostridia bacterium]|nr:hypothetical protein [Clostridia bacterium]